VEVVDPLEVVEIEKEQDASRLGLERFRQRADELAPVGEASRRVGIGVAVRGALRLVIGLKRLFQVLRAPPAEQDNRAVEDECHLERVDGIRERSAEKRRWQETASEADEQHQCCDGRASRNEVAAGYTDSLILGSTHPVHPLFAVRHGKVNCRKK